MELNRKTLAALFLAVFSVIAFQNCSESVFKKKESDPSTKGDGAALEVELPGDQDPLGGDEGDGVQDGDDAGDDAGTDPEDPGGNAGGPPDDHPGNPGGPPGGDASASLKACNFDSIKDIVVNALRLETNGRAYLLEDSIGSTSLISFANGFVFTSDEDVDLNQFRLILAEDGHYILDQDNHQFFAKVPSGAQTGLKVVTRGLRSLPAGSYRLRVELNPETQVVRAGDICIIKPKLFLRDVVNLADIY